MRLLLIKTSSLGDVVHVMPAISEAASNITGLRIDWVVEETYAPVARLHCAVEEVISVAIRRWRRNPWRATTRREWQGFCDQLKSAQYDLVLDAQGLLKSAWVAFQANGPRAGLNWRTAREPLASLFYQKHFDVPREIPAIDRNRLLVAQALGYSRKATAPNYGIKTNHPNWSSDCDASMSERIFCFHGSARIEKCWPEERWVSLGQELARRGLPLTFPSGTGAEYERALRIAAAIEKKVPRPSLVEALEPTSLDPLIKAIARAKAVIGGDTGLLHLAAGLKRPGVGIFLATHPTQFGVRPDASGPPFVNLDPTMSQSVDAVLEAALQVIGQ